MEERTPAKQTIDKFLYYDKKFDGVENSMNNLSTEIKLMKKDVQMVCEKLEQNTIEHKEILAKIDKFIETADKRYAEKKVEDLIGKILWTLGFMIVGAIAAAVFRLIFK